MKDARAIDNTITLKDVTMWKEPNLHKSKQLRGYNNYISSEPKFKYQVDPCVNLEDQKFPYGMLAVDILRGT